MKKAEIFIGSVSLMTSFVAFSASVLVSVPEDTTYTLAEAFQNGCVSGVSDYAGLCAADDLQISGAGRLVIDKDLATDGFTGEVHVLAGATLRLTVKGSLGDTAKGTYVANGATLETKAVDETTASTLDFIGEPLTFAGTGVDGTGVLKALSSAQQRNGVWGGTVMTMSGDATIYQEKTTQIFPSEQTNSLNMNGYKLTIVGSHQNNSLPFRAIISNPGDIDVENVHLMVRSVAVFPGGEEHMLTVGDNGRFQLYDCGAATRANRTWKLCFPSQGVESAFVIASKASTWDGPVEIARPLMVSLNVPLELAGAVTASKPVTFVGSSSPRQTVTFISNSTDLKGVVADGVDVVLASVQAKADGVKLVNGGKLKITPEGQDVRFYAGWNFGEQTEGYSSWSDPYYKYGTYGSVTNKVVFDVAELHSDVKCKQYLGTFYNGYIWNPNAYAVTWRFASCSSTLAGLKVNGSTVISKQPQNEVAFGNATLQPGANRFEYYLATSVSKTRNCPEPTNSTTWTNGYGLAYSKTSTTSVDSADFAEFSDPGDGSLMRIAEEGSSYWNELRAASMCNRSISVLSSAPGDEFDVGKDEVTIAVVTGFPKIVSSYLKSKAERVSVSTQWSMNAEEVLEGAKLESNLAIDFGDNTVLSVENWKLLQRDLNYVIAESSAGIVGLPKIAEEHKGRISLQKSVDGTSLSIKRIGRGLFCIIR